MHYEFIDIKQFKTSNFKEITRGLDIRTNKNL